MSNPDVKDEAGDRARLVADLKEVRGYPLIGRGTRGRRINSLIGQAIAALSSDAKDKRIAELEAAIAEEGLIWEENDSGVLQLVNEPAIAHAVAAFKANRRAEAAEAQLRLTGTEEAGVREDAERWRALMSSGKLHFMGCAGFEFSNSIEGSRALATSAATPRPGDDMHFGMEFWAEAKAGPEYPDNFERGFMVVYVDEIRRRTTTRRT